MPHYAYGYAITPKDGLIAGYTIPDFRKKLDTLCKIRNCGMVNDVFFIPDFAITPRNREFIETYILRSVHAVSTTLIKMDMDQFEKARKEAPQIWQNTRAVVY